MIEDKMIDFSNCIDLPRSFGGSDRKKGILYNNEAYMIKFSEKHAKQTDISTSYVNNVISEYVSSHISASTGLTTHETLLGLYDGEVVVACKDFRGNGEENLEFADLMRTKYDSKEIKRSPRLDQIYNTLESSKVLSDTLKQLSIMRYWDTFIVDALVGNFDRHIGNWGYLSKGVSVRLAPVYDYGSTLYPQMSDDGMKDMINSEYEKMKRCLVFPSPALFITDKKVGKIGYYDLMASGYDNNCTEAVKRMVPLINMEEIYSIVDNTPFISDIRKDFYKTMIKLRKEVILDRAYTCCLWNKYDKNAVYRINNGIQYSEEMLKEYMKNGVDNTAVNFSAKGKTM